MFVIYDHLYQFQGTSSVVVFHQVCCCGLEINVSLRRCVAYDDDRLIFLPLKPENHVIELRKLKM